MKRLIATAFVLSMTSLGLVGCDEQRKSTSTHEMKIDTPNGTTTITTEREVKETKVKPETKTP